MTSFVAELRDVLARGQDLPTFPAVALELHSALDSETLSDSQVAAIVSRDPPLATRLLRLANSAAFNRGAPVGEVTQAVRVLGLRQVRALCTALAVVGAFSKRRGGLPLKSFWFHSAGVAFAARELAGCLGYRHLAPEQLYVGGLLHDIGLLLLDQYFPERMQGSLVAAQRRHDSLAKVESDVLGMDHGEIGGLLLGRWSLPAPIVAMVTSHHHPQDSSPEHRDACWVVYAAEMLCRCLGPSLQVEQLAETRAFNVLNALREAQYPVDKLVDGIQQSAQESATILT
jgi:putative nucleotidyltransferase with HDIG domain